MGKLYSLLNSGSVLSLFLQVIPITLLVGVIYAVYRCIRIKKHGKIVSWGTEIMRWLFVCYLTGLRSASDPRQELPPDRPGAGCGQERCPALGEARHGCYEKIFEKSSVSEAPFARFLSLVYER